MMGSEQKEMLTHRNITVRVDDLQISLQVERTEKAEEEMRNATKRVNHLFALYQRQYPEATKKELLIYVALHLANALESEELQRERSELIKRLSTLAGDLDALDT